MTPAAEVGYLLVILFPSSSTQILKKNIYIVYSSEIYFKFQLTLLKALYIFFKLSLQLVLNLKIGQYKVNSRSLQKIGNSFKCFNVMFK